jgi:hypothetical protein
MSKRLAPLMRATGYQLAVVLPAPARFGFRWVCSGDCAIPRGVRLCERPVSGQIRLRTVVLAQGEVAIGACRSRRYRFAIRPRIRNCRRSNQQDADETCSLRCHTASRRARTGMPLSSVRTIPAHACIAYALDQSPVAAPAFVQASPVADPRCPVGAPADAICGSVFTLPFLCFCRRGEKRSGADERNREKKVPCH